jgi:glyoxylase-like metal-dependent hydrolase (beta-lactamase superfamily II)
MIIKTLPVGQLEANCYVIADEEEGSAIVIDPGDEPDTIMDTLGDMKVSYIVLTHAHFDHAGAVAEIKEATGAELLIHVDERDTYAGIQEHAEYWGFRIPELPPPDNFLSEGDKITLGTTEFTVIHTPGHSPGGISLYTKGVVFTGDTLFMGSVGRTDLKGGNINNLKNSFRKLMLLPEDTKVLSGHGPATTIGREKYGNMFSGQFLS